MSRKVKTLLDELTNLSPSTGDKFKILDIRADHLINSSINLLEMINDQFSKEEAEDLTKRFINSIKTADIRKFKRGIKFIKESKNNKV